MPDNALIDAFLRQHWPAKQARSVLAIGAGSPTIAALCAELSPQATLTEKPQADQLAFDAPFDCAILHGALEEISIDAGSVLIAQLRDLHCQRLLVTLQNGGATPWTEKSLRALGLSRTAVTDLECGTFVLYEFSLSDYKTTPNWLNRNHWANPDNWDKFRW